MKKFTLFLTVVFLCMIFVMPSHPIKKLAQTGLQFLKIDVGARPAAMAGAFMMVGNDASAMFYNPAGIALFRSTTDLFVSRTEWIVETKYNAAAIVQNFGNWGNVGLSLITCDYGEIMGTRFASTTKGYEDTGPLDIGGYAVGVAYARQLTDKFSLGAHVKYAHQRLGENDYIAEDTGERETVENKVSGLAYDLGTLFYPGFRSFRMGMSIRNFSPQFVYQNTEFELPLTFTLGFAIDIFDFVPSLQESQSLVLAVDAVHPRDYTERLHIGGEYWYMDMIALRGGYKFNYDEESFTAGAGIKYEIEGGFALKIDYSYSDMEFFDAINRISIGASF